MWSRARILAGKDIRVIVSNGQGLAQSALMGLLLIFVFSLAQDSSQPIDPQWAAAIFWLATSFSLVLIFNTLYGLEEDNEARLGLILSPLPAQGIWLAKALAGWLLLLLVQGLFLPASIIFLGIGQIGSWLQALILLLIVDWGLVVLGSLLGGPGPGAERAGLPAHGDRLSPADPTAPGRDQGRGRVADRGTRGSSRLLVRAGRSL